VSHLSISSADNVAIAAAAPRQPMPAKPADGLGFINWWRTRVRCTYTASLQQGSFTRIFEPRGDFVFDRRELVQDPDKLLRRRLFGLAWANGPEQVSNEMTFFLLHRKPKVIQS